MSRNEWKTLKWFLDLLSCQLNVSQSYECNDRLGHEDSLCSMFASGQHVPLTPRRLPDRGGRGWAGWRSLDTTRQEEPGWLMCRWAWGRGLLPLLAAPGPHPAPSASPAPSLGPGPSPEQKAERQPVSTWPAGTTGSPSSCLAVWPVLARHGRCPFSQLWSWGWQELHRDSRRPGPRARSPACPPQCCPVSQAESCPRAREGPAAILGHFPSPTPLPAEGVPAILFPQHPGA